MQTLVAALADNLAEFQTAMEHITDTETAEAEIQAIRAGATQQIAQTQEALARQTQHRHQAEEAAEKAREAATELSAQRDAADQGRQQAERNYHDTEQRAAQAVRDADNAIAQARQGEAEAKAETDRVRAETTAHLTELRSTNEQRISELSTALEEARHRAQRAEAALDSLASEHKDLQNRVRDLTTQLTKLRGRPDQPNEPAQ